jgi:hypothetical protein
LVFEGKRHKYENEREVMSDLYDVRGSNGGDCGRWIHLLIYSTITQPYVTEVTCNVTTALVEKPVKIERTIFASPISSYDINTDPARFQVSAAM